MQISHKSIRVTDSMQIPVEPWMLLAWRDSQNQKLTKTLCDL